jgi:hypothetical protein
MDQIETIKKLLGKYSKAVEQNDKVRRDDLYEQIMNLGKKLKVQLKTLDPDVKKEARLILSEISIIFDDHEAQLNKLFTKSNGKAKESSEKQEGLNKFSSNDQYLVESKKLSKNTTEILKKSMVDIEKSLEIGKEGLEILVDDNKKLSIVTNNLDKIQEESSQGLKLLTRFTKRLYTDKLIGLFICLIICLIVLILLFKYNII